MITPSQIESFNENGYLGIENVISDDDIYELRRVIDGIIEESREVSTHTDIFDIEPGHNREDPQLRRIKNPMRFDSVFERVMRNNNIIDIVAALIGPGVRFLPGSDVINMKQAKVGSPVEWHQDWAFAPMTNNDILAVGVLIDDMVVENGALLVLPGTHKGPIYNHHQNGIFVGAITDTALQVDDAVPVELKAGGISIHHPRVLHASMPNVSDRSRRFLIFNFCALDNWPLMGPPDWDKFTDGIMRGEPTLELRLEVNPVRAPFPKGERGGSIFEVQLMVEKPGLGAKGS